jgi:hypothetical protein
MSSSIACEVEVEVVWPTEALAFDRCNRILILPTIYRRFWLALLFRVVPHNKSLVTLSPIQQARTPQHNAHSFALLTRHRAIGLTDFDTPVLLLSVELQ